MVPAFLLCFFPIVNEDRLFKFVKDLVKLHSIF